MTVEAAVVLPLFLFFMAEVLTIFDMIRLQSRYLQALHETGTLMSELAFYREYAVSSDRSETIGEERVDEGAGLSDYAVSLAMTETFVRSRTEDYLGRDYLDHTCLAGGAGGGSYLRSRIMEDDVIDLVADYRVKPILPLFGLDGFSQQSRYYAHAWTGYRIGNAVEKDEDGENGEIVYITATGSVYHMDSACTYLRPHTRTVPASSLSGLRSRDGSRYYACENCRPAASGTVVIAEYGNRYHRSSSCSSIHRDVTAVRLSQVEDTMRACSKCGGE